MIESQHDEPEPAMVFSIGLTKASCTRPVGAPGMRYRWGRDEARYLMWLVIDSAARKLNQNLGVKAWTRFC